MHTSKVLQPEHFRFTRPAGDEPLAFDALCPDYHPQDRIAVVAPHFDTGVLHTAYALLAFTTAFYDALRQRHDQFFDYPQHFCILDADGATVATSRGRVPADTDALGGAWTNLDVWPECKWHTAAGTPAAMLQKVFDLQINRVLWPADFRGDDAPALPGHVRATLNTYLKQVWYYNAATPTLELRAAEPAEAMVATSITRLPGCDAAAIEQVLARRGLGDDGLSRWVEHYEQVEPAAFLDEHLPASAA